MYAAILAAFALCLGAAAPPAIQADPVLINTPNANWNVYGTAQTHRGVRDKRVQGGGAVRVTIAAKPAQPWDAGAANPFAKPIRKGDRLMLALWVRLESGGTDGRSEIAASIQSSSPPYDPIVTGRVPVTPEWTLVHVRGVAERDAPANGATIALSLGTQAHVVDLGPAYVFQIP